jgi:NhaP-type Na+/H+ or K+/H+ antiporter
MYQNAAILAAFLLIYSAFAGRVERSWISGPIVFTGIGFVLGPDALGVLRINISGEGLRLLAELTLSMVLFTDAANADFGVVGRNLGLPERLLLVGLPAQAAGGSGFIACFVGGLLLSGLGARHKEELLRGAEHTGEALALLTWVVFGGIVVARMIDRVTWPALLYAVLSLTVIRMLPVFLCLIGTRTSTADRLFIGWFGPRGLATIVFAVLVLDEKLIMLAAGWTVPLSVIAHGGDRQPARQGDRGASRCSGLRSGAAVGKCSRRLIEVAYAIRSRPCRRDPDTSL